VDNRHCNSIPPASSQVPALYPSAPGASLPDGRQLYPQIWLAALAASKTRRDRGRSADYTRCISSTDRRESAYAKFSTPPAGHPAKYTRCSIFITSLPQLAGVGDYLENSPSCSPDFDYYRILAVIGMNNQI